MPSHEHSDEFPNPHEPEKVDASLGYEKSDVKVTGIVVFLTALAIFVAVIGVVSYGVGKVLNAYLNKEDGPTSKWATTVNIRSLGNMPNNPEMQRKVAVLTQKFPTPRLQNDNTDGGDDLVNLHQREDLLLNNYSWIDQSKGTVRIPIQRAMELIAQRGLPVAPPVQQPTLMTGDSKPTVVMPLTNGFAPTGLEQEMAATRAAEAKRGQE
ncbi:MAG TPA: hypothetical protein VMU48_09415 [Terracidiphilus sp.]|nr:hypothetical protein [Terracidiphilus sp.]